MSATQDLIAAALTAADLLDEMWLLPQDSREGEKLREACARAMVQPDMAEVERLVNEFGASCNSVAKRGHITSFKPLGQQITEHRASRTTLLDYVRGIMAERDAADELRRLHALCEEMSEALNALLFLINRDAPQLSGKTMGYAQTALAKWKESK